MTWPGERCKEVKKDDERWKKKVNNGNESFVRKKKSELYSNNKFDHPNKKLDDNKPMLRRKPGIGNFKKKRSSGKQRK